MMEYNLVGFFDAIIPGRTNPTYQYVVVVSQQNRQVGWKPSIDAPIVFPLYRRDGGTNIPVLADDVTPEDVLVIPQQLSEMTKGKKPLLEVIIEANRNTAQEVVDVAPKTSV